MLLYSSLKAAGLTTVDPTPQMGRISQDLPTQNSQVLSVFTSLVSEPVNTKLRHLHGWVDLEILFCPSMSHHFIRIISFQNY
mmetsp:Transcript_47534/g.100984  ORF Transcript_47534/g.100984 Transcript_47534/m.100984 type:complete len:82 (-) Transcript_47534:244-489(-)